MWIKICGMTSDAAIEAALDAKVDAVGFVFAPSIRQLAPERAAHLARRVPRSVLRVAVFQHPSQAAIDDVVAQLKPDVVQTDHEDLSTLTLPKELLRFPVLRAQRSRPNPLPRRVLFEGAVSGTGTTTDWNAAERIARETELILAGGLNAANVAEAIARVRPFGVDVSSGVESAPGVKDPRKIADFVRAARAADMKVGA